MSRPAALTSEVTEQTRALRQRKRVSSGVLLVVAVALFIVLWAVGVPGGVFTSLSVAACVLASGELVLAELTDRQVAAVEADAASPG